MDFSFLSFVMLPLKEAQQNKTPFSWLECLTAGFRGRDAHLNYTVVSSIQCLTDRHLSNKLLCGTEDQVWRRISTTVLGRGCFQKKSFQMLRNLISQSCPHMTYDQFLHKDLQLTFITSPIKLLLWFIATMHIQYLSSDVEARSITLLICLYSQDFGFRRFRNSFIESQNLRPEGTMRTSGMTSYISEPFSCSQLAQYQAQ